MRTDWTPAESHKQVFEEGEFSQDVLNALRARGQMWETVPPQKEGLVRGYWIGIKIDPQTHQLRGGQGRWLT